MESFALALILLSAFLHAFWNFLAMVLVLILAGISGCLMPRDLMPEFMQQISLVTPQAWALQAYMQLLLSRDPNLMIVMQSSAVLIGFGVGFLALAWSVLKLD